MSGQVKGIMGFFVVCAIGLAGIIVFNMSSTSSSQLSTSAAVNFKHKIVVAVDGWDGYAILCDEMTVNRLRAQQIDFSCDDDGADYNNRMKRLRNGDIQMAVAEIGAYVKEGKNYKYPGVIVAVIDTSMGGDALLARTDKYPTIQDLKNDKTVKIAVTLDSPSEVFARITSLHFGIPAITREDWAVPAKNAKDAFAKLDAGVVDVAVLWEPYVTQALKSGEYTRLISTRDMQNSIVDVLMASRDFSTNNPKLVKQVNTAYFQTLQHYKQNNDDLIAMLKKRNPTLSTDDIKSLIAGIHWVNVTENCKQWFACDETDWKARQGVMTSITDSVSMWEQFGILDSPLPDNNPYLLYNAEYMTNLMAEGLNAGSTGGATIVFAALPADEWDSLDPIGTLQNQNIQFQSGTHRMTADGQKTLDGIGDNLQHYASSRIRVSGHTKKRGNVEKNQTLSEKRAKAVMTYLIRQKGIDKNRIIAVGYGGDRPLHAPPGTNTNSRGYQKKLMRVELELFREPI